MEAEVGYDSYNQYTDYVVPMEEFSTEDNQLLMSVLNSGNNEDHYGHPHSGGDPSWSIQSRFGQIHREDVKKNIPTFTPHTSRHDTSSMNTPQQHLNNQYFSGNPMTHHSMISGHMNDYPYLHSQSEVPKREGYAFRPSNSSQFQDDYFGGDSSKGTVYSPSKSEHTSDEETSTNSNNQKSKRRESQNRASRNYRQRKKAYIKEIEAQLDRLRVENEQLRSENVKNKRVIDQFRTTSEKPAPLLRSYSSELQNEDEEIEKLVSELNMATIDEYTTSEELQTLLGNFHNHVSKRQQILQKEALQFVTPKMQERLVRLEGIPPNRVAIQMDQWLQDVSKFASEEQIAKLSDLRQRHHTQRAEIYNERSQINREIKEFYHEKIASERLNGPGNIDQDSVLGLTSKLEELKKNLIRESDLNSESVNAFSSILTPRQEAIITIKHYSFYRDKISSIQMLNNVWSVIAKEKI